MQGTLTKKLNADVLVNFACNFVINALIAKYIAESKTPPMISVYGAEFLADIFLTTFLVAIIVFEISKRTVAGKFRKGTFDVRELTSGLRSLLRCGAPLAGKAGKAALKIFGYSLVVSCLVFAGFFLMTASQIDPMAYAMFKGILCAVVSVPATVCAFGAAVHMTSNGKPNCGTLTA